MNDAGFELNHLIQQSSKLRIWARSRLWAQVLAAMVLGVGIAILASVAAGFGIPATGLVIILGVDRLLDMSRTVVNVTGDITAAVLMKNTLA